MNRKSIDTLSIFMVILNFIAVLFHATIFLYGTKYIIAIGGSHALLESMGSIPTPPESVYFLSIILYALLVFFMYRGNIEGQSDKRMRIITDLEFVVMVLLIFVMYDSYNGFILLVFADMIHRSRDGKNWLFYTVVSFVAMLLCNYDLITVFFKVPSIEAYISFFPAAYRGVLLFFKNLLPSTNIVLFIIAIITMLMDVSTERQKVEAELEIASKINTDLESYMALTEKIAQDHERKRIARELHDTLGHALTGISAGIDASLVLMDIDPERAKTQLNRVGKSVTTGIEDVRRSLKKLRPEALEDKGLKEALDQMISDYKELSKLDIQLYYEWDRVDFDNAKEDIVFRVIQESITNSLRHGHAKHVEIEMYNTEDMYCIVIQDDGKGCENVVYGYGLTQMEERLAVIGGRVTFKTQDGFRTLVEIPKGRSEVNDQSTYRG